MHRAFPLFEHTVLPDRHEEPETYELALLMQEAPINALEARQIRQEVAKGAWAA